MLGARMRRTHGSAVFDCLETRSLLAVLTMAGVKNITAVEGASFSGVVAYLADTTIKASPSSFNTAPGSIQIDWGDGQTSSGSAVGPLILPGAFQITGSHTYGQPGTYSVLVSVTDTSGDDASALSTATVTAVPFPIQVNTLSGAPGASLPANNNVASFITPNPADNSPADFGAIINWGDGQSTAGTVTGGPLVYTVTGSHTYAAAGSFTTSVTVAVANGPTSTGAGLATITSPSAYTPTSRAIVTPVSQLFSGTVATFTDSNTTDAASNFTASIAWGDGGTTPGIVTGSNGSFAVQGSYTYQTAGTEMVTVTVWDQLGNTFPVMDTATVTSAPPPNSTVSFSGSLADISANGPNAVTGYTDSDEPTFSGTTVPYSIVNLYARLSSVDTTLPLGQAVATANGQWSFTSGPLTDGLYTITATVTPPAGFPSAMIPIANNGQIVIDTVPPQVVGVSVIGPGRVVVSFRDDLSGMDTGSLQYLENYTFAGPGVVALHPNAVSLLPSGNLPTDAREVRLTIRAKPRVFAQIRDLRISGTNSVSIGPNLTTNVGITDNAGNVLEGSLDLPAGVADGRAAGNYLVKVNFRHFRR
jgi:hypothetical protein